MIARTAEHEGWSSVPLERHRQNLLHDTRLAMRADTSHHGELIRKAGERDFGREVVKVEVQLGAPSHLTGQSLNTLARRDCVAGQATVSHAHGTQLKRCVAIHGRADHSSTTRKSGWGVGSDDEKRKRTNVRAANDREAKPRLVIGAGREYTSDTVRHDAISVGQLGFAERCRRTQGRRRRGTGLRHRKHSYG